MVKNLPPKAGEAGSTPGQRTKIPHAGGQLSPLATRKDPACWGATEPPSYKERSRMLQLGPAQPKVSK